MLYRRKFDLDVEEIRPELNTLRNASHELRSSTKFKLILQVEDSFVLSWMQLSDFLKAVLVIGNTLNGSTFRGGARGFRLDALLKVLRLLVTVLHF